MILPALSEFLAQCQGQELVPVWREILADIETPVSAYWKIAHEEPFSFLLESVTGGEQVARYSVIGVRPRAILRTKDRVARLFAGGDLTTLAIPEGQDPLDLLRAHLRTAKIPSGSPKFVGGAIGILGYDIVRFFEELPDETEDDLEADDLAMMITDAVVVFDHARNSIRIVVLAEPDESGYQAAVEEIERIANCLASPLPNLPNGRFYESEVTANSTSEEYCSGVRRIIDYIAAGDGIQMVLSRRKQCRLDAHPLTVYRALRALNPSPYMFLLRFDDFDVIGASPELLVSLEGSSAKVRPIAGTRPRGKDLTEDLQLESQLLADEKERAEHIMLVDLGRNDLGRVCEYGTVEVTDLMRIERYSHVMHIVSDVRGIVRNDFDAIDLVRATFPAGTVSGAPKVRAMEIIEELEPTRRGLYAGAIGYFGANGDVDLAIAIRTIYVKKGVAYVQSGAGIVYDSIPSREDEECSQKAKACLDAIALAQRGI